MTTECTQEPFPFHPLSQREVRGQFDRGSITSDAGGLLLREVEKATGIVGQFANCFTDYRDPELREHAVAELVAQRIYGLALGYEDLNDHEELRRDPLLGVGREGGSDGERSAAGARSGHRPGGQEHAKPDGTGGGEVREKGAV